MLCPHVRKKFEVLGDRERTNKINKPDFRITPTLKNKRKVGEDMSKKKEISKDTLVNREINRLTALYKDIERSKRLTAKGLIEEIAFMRITLKELKTEIDKNGPIDEMAQGDYSILREHPALKAYNTMVQRYSSLIKQLTDLLPKEIKVVDEDDGFADFISTRT